MWTFSYVSGTAILAGLAVVGLAAYGTYCIGRDVYAWAENS